MISRRRRDVVGLVFLGVMCIVLPLTFVSINSASAAAPGPPTNCQAVVQGNSILVTWDRPANDGGSPIWAYVVKEIGYDPTERFEHPNGRGNELDLRSHSWGRGVDSTPVMGVRAVNSDTNSVFCQAPVGATPPPTTTAPTTPPPTTVPTTTVPTTTTPTTTAPPSGRPFIPYSGNSFLTDLVTNEPINQALTTEFQNFMATFPDQAGTPYPKLNGIPGSAGAKWGTTYDFGTDEEPMWTSGKCGISFHARASLGQSVTGTSDSPLLVIDQASGKSVFFTKVGYAGGTALTVGGSCGVMYHTSNGLDADNPLSNDERNTTSRGRISEMLAIRKDLFDWAEANGSDLGHGLHFFIAESDDNGLCGDGTRNCNGVHPMTGEESPNAGFGEEGTRIAVAQNASLGTCTAEAMVLVRTLQNYGAVIGDNAGGASTLKVGIEPTPIADLQQNELQGCIDWNDWVVIQPGSQVSP